MRRWHQEYARTYNEWKFHSRTHVEGRQVGRFRKKKSFDCGKTGCLACHSDKFPKRTKTWQEKNAEMKYNEGIEEVN